jgi:hypothetical protein
VVARTWWDVFSSIQSFLIQILQLKNVYVPRVGCYISAEREVLVIGIEISQLHSAGELSVQEAVKRKRKW